MKKLSVEEQIDADMILDAAKRVRDAFKKGMIKEEQFLMSYFSAGKGCNTIHCIGGWIGVFMGRDGDSPIHAINAEMDDTLGHLQYPEDNNNGWRANTSMAIKALNNFIKSPFEGNPWKGVR